MSTTRLFSNVKFDGDDLIHAPGNIWNCGALVAGTTIGAGILAMPAVTVDAGVIPSSVTLTGVWLYMVISGLLLTEVNLNTMCSLGRRSSGLLVMAHRTLGSVGAWSAGAFFLILQYSLMVAYIARGGTILSQVLGSVDPLPARLGSIWVGSIVFTGVLVNLMFWGRERSVVRVNSGLVAIVISIFLVLIGLNCVSVVPSRLLIQHWPAIHPGIPIMVVALVYHSVVPIVASRLEGNRPKIRQAIILGTTIPLVMLLVWNAVILGSLQPDWLMHGVLGQRFDPLEILRQRRPWLGYLISLFSELAMATSFIGMGYGLLHFFRDVLHLELQQMGSRCLAFGLVTVPTLLLAVLTPDSFFVALDYAGIFGVSILFGILPALMAWRQRYHLQLSKRVADPLVPGGRGILGLVMGLALVMIGVQIRIKLGSFF